MKLADVKIKSECSEFGGPLTLSLVPKLKTIGDGPIEVFGLYLEARDNLTEVYGAVSGGQRCSHRIYRAVSQGQVTIQQNFLGLCPEAREDLTGIYRVVS